MGIFRQEGSTPGVNQTFTTATGSSSFSNAVGLSTAVIRVAVTSDTYCNISQTGGNAVATANSMIVPTGQVERFAVLPGQSQVGFMAVTTAGKISITQL